MASEGMYRPCPCPTSLKWPRFIWIHSPLRRHCPTDQIFGALLLQTQLRDDQVDVILCLNCRLLCRLIHHLLRLLPASFVLLDAVHRSHRREMHLQTICLIRRQRYCWCDHRWSHYASFYPTSLKITNEAEPKGHGVRHKIWKPGLM